MLVDFKDYQLFTEKKQEKKKYLALLQEYDIELYKNWMEKKNSLIRQYQIKVKNEEQFKGLFEIHIDFLESFLNKQLRTKREINFKAIRFSKNIECSDNHKEKIIDLIFTNTKFFNKKTLEIFKKYILEFDDECSHSYISPTEEKIVIKMDSNSCYNLLKIYHDFIHEIGHLLEYHLDTKVILQQMIKYLKLRALKDSKGKPLIKSRSHVSSHTYVYENNLYYEDAGIVYHDIFLDTEKPYTEMFAFGLGMMFYNPIEFYFNDPDYFNLIYNVFFNINEKNK